MIDRIRTRMKRRARLKRDEALQDSGWYDLSVRSSLDAVFVGGCGRSGTTLFKEVMNRHSRCASGPETSLYGLPFSIDNIAVPWGIDREHLDAMQRSSSNLIEFADTFATEFLAQEQKARWIEKTPNTVRAIEKVLTWYPNGKFIHVIRDGRDVVCSLRHHPRERVRNGKIVQMNPNNPVSKSAKRWISDTMHGLAMRGHPRYMEVRYEDLVRDPEEGFRRVFEFIGEPYEDGVLVPDADAPKRPGQNLNNAGASAPISAKSVGRWRKDLSPSERDDFVNIGGELLIALGYAADHSWARG
jgi:hypothetical protein